MQVLGTSQVGCIREWATFAAKASVAERKFLRFTDGGKPRVGNHEGRNYVVDMLTPTGDCCGKSIRPLLSFTGKPWRDHCAQSGAEWNVLLRPKIPPPEPRFGFQEERDAAKEQELYLKSDTWRS